MAIITDREEIEKKDRYTLLSDVVLETIRRDQKEHGQSKWLFRAKTKKSI